MDNDRLKSVCADPTQELTLQLPCRLAERIYAYASKNDTDITHVVIEALDIFLRSQKSDTY
jgi:hypothetical protein